MYIGIFDQDIQLYPSKFVPSLELMKLSSYHKRRGDVVEFCTSLDGTEKYDKLYLSRGTRSEKNLPSSFLTQPNVEWVGRGFTGNYIQLPQEIEESSPDKTFYRTFVDSNKHLFNHHIYCELIRDTLSDDTTLLRITNGNKLIIDYKKLNYSDRTLIFYDYNFFLSPFAKEIIEYFYSRNNIIKFILSSLVEDWDTFQYCSDKVRSVHSMKQVMYLVDYDYPQNFLIKNYQYFNQYCGLYEPILDQQPTKRTFTKLANFYFYNVSKKKSIKIQTDSLSKSDFDFYRRLIFTLCDFTQMTSAHQDTSILKRASVRGEKFYNILSKQVLKDQTLFNFCNANPKLIYENGVWRL